MTDPMNDIATAEREARADAAWLAAHGYETSVHVWTTALNNYGPESSRTTYAAGYAVKYAGQLVRDDGTRAEYPTAGITVYCQDSQLPLAKVLAHGRMLVTFSPGGEREYGPYTPYYVASWNPRQTDLQNDQDINPGILPHVHMHAMTPGIGQDGPMRFYEMRLYPAGDLPTGTRVRVVATEESSERSEHDWDNLFAGQVGVIRHPHYAMPLVELDPVYDPVADTTRPWGQLRQFSRASLEAVPEDTAGERDMFAYVDAQGTAMAETAVCSIHLADRTGAKPARDAAEATLRTCPPADAWDGRPMHKCTGNDQLACIVCGWPGE